MAICMGEGEDIALAEDPWRARRRLAAWGSARARTQWHGEFAVKPEGLRSLAHLVNLDSTAYPRKAVLRLSEGHAQGDTGAVAALATAAG